MSHLFVDILCLASVAIAELFGSMQVACAAQMSFCLSLRPLTGLGQLSACARSVSSARQGSVMKKSILSSW